MTKLSDFIADFKNNVGLPIAYHHFKPNQSPKLPYVIYYSTGDDALKADNMNYFKIKNLNIELYSALKDEVNELKITDFFDSNCIAYDTFESYIESEKMYEVTYQINLF